MKLKKFRIQNYKSIINSGFCYLASDLTILAGKNESGKTAVLEAIRDFSPSILKIPQTARPIHESEDTRIELYFSLSDDERKKIIKKIQFPDSDTEKLLKPEIGLWKDIDGNYEFTEEIDNPYVEYVDKYNKYKIDQISAASKKILSFFEKIDIEIQPPDYNNNIRDYLKDIEEFILDVERNLSEFNISQDDKKEVTTSLNSIKAYQKEVKTYDNYFKLVEELKSQIPNVILFSDFVDLLPHSVLFTEASNKQTVKNFATISGLDLSRVIDSKLDSHQRMNLLKRSSAKISGDFKEYWEQDELKLNISSDGQKLVFTVEEKGKEDCFKPEHRSKGFQWFLSFYLRLKAEKGKTNVILIDEPGLYVHAKAQRDILHVLESLSNDMQIIFSTHSPYLIDNERMDRIRLVKKTSDGTTIENKIHKNADKDTLTPIVTAIGLDLSNSFSVVGDNNIILEGFSDYYYLSGMRKKLARDGLSDKHFIPCVGATKIPMMVSLIMGWGLNFIALLDNDSEGIRVGDDLKNKYHVDSEKVLNVSSRSNTRIEDLFSTDDFHKHIINGSIKPDAPNKLSNSDYLSKNKMDKVLLAKQFFEKINNDEKLELSKETITNFSDLFKKIEAAF